MANNETIQILRTNGITDNNKDVALLEGQPFYNMQKNYLTIGDKANGGKKANAEPITVRKLIGYFNDNNGVTNSIDESIDKDAYKYSIYPTIAQRGENTEQALAIAIDSSDKIKVTNTRIIFANDVISSKNANFNIVSASQVNATSIKASESLVSNLLKDNGKGRSTIALESTGETSNSNNDSITINSPNLTISATSVIAANAQANFNSVIASTNVKAPQIQNSNQNASIGLNDNVLDLASSNININGTLNISNNNALNFKDSESTTKATIKYNSNAIVFEFPQV